MKRTVTIALCMLAISFLPLAAQDSGDQDRPEFEERITLDLYLIDIVAVDERGNYVNGLTADDFTVLEDGKKVNIVSVDEFFSQKAIADDAARAAGLVEETSPPRNIVLIIDRFFSSGYGIKQGKEAVRRFVEENLRPEDRVMLMTFDREFTIHQDFTTNHPQLLAKIEDISAASKSLYTPEFLTTYSSQADRQMGLSSMNRSNSDIETSPVDTIQNVRFEQDVRKYYESLRQLSTAMKSIPGRKTVILLSEGYDSRVVNDARGGFDDNIRATNRVEMEESIGGASGVPTGGIRTGSTLFNSYINTITRINDSATSYYVVDIASLDSQTSRTDVFEERSFSKNNEYDTARINSLATLAENTGGKLYSNIKNMGRVINDINYDISNYYVIGYRSENTRHQGEFRNIEVKSNLPGVEIRHRKGFFEKKAFTTMSNQEQFVHLVSGFFRSSPDNEMNGGSAMFFLPIDLNTFVASLAVNIPAEELPGDGEKTLEFIGQVLDNTNKRVDAFHKVLDYSNHLRDLQNEGRLRLTIPFVLKTGTNKVQVIVRNNATGERLYHFKDYNVVGTADDEISMSSLALLDPRDPHSSVHNYKLDLIDKGADTGYEGFRVIDPLRASVGTPVFPMINTTINANQDVIAFFSAANFWQDENTREVNLFIDYVLVDKQGKEQQVKVGQERFIPVPGTRRINVLSQLSFADVQPGEYDLVVRFLDRELVQGLKRTIPITIQ